MNAAIENMKTRRSVRKFKADAVPQELIEQVIEAGTFAASGHDRQPWALIAVTNRDVIARLSAANASFFDMDVKDPFYGAPAVIIVLTKKSTPTYIYDGTMAMDNMMLAAHSLGLASCWIHRAKQVFELPEWKEWLHSIGVDGDYEGIGHVALGYADGPLPEARPRKAGRVFYVK
jgi:nitroreductase